MVNGCYVCTDGDKGRACNHSLLADMLLWVATNNPAQIIVSGNNTENVPVTFVSPPRNELLNHGTYHDFIEAMSWNIGKYLGTGSINESHQMGWNHARNIKHTGVMIFTRK
jgi:hypothetical protein